MNEHFARYFDDDEDDDICPDTDILLFAGTTEGRRIAEALKGLPVEVYVCVATEYGETLIEESSNIHVLVGRKNQEEMEALINAYDVGVVLDATHPYAVEVTESLKEACKQTNVTYYRILRGEDHGDLSNTKFFDNTECALDYLNQTQGPVLLTVGSKELPKYTTVQNFRERLYARVLPLPQVISGMTELGFSAKNIIAMQGPFTEEINIAMLRMLGIRYLVTKDTGIAGGFSEKLQAARACGVETLVIRRPTEEEGISLEACLKMLQKAYCKRPLKKVTILGIGTGSVDTMTVGAEEALRGTERIIGAKRICDSLLRFAKPITHAIAPEKIAEAIRESPELRFVVAMSGDTGFYSGTKKLLPLLQSEFDVNVLPGISSPIYLCSRLGISWDDAILISTHGRTCNFLGKIRKYPKVLMLTGGEWDVNTVIDTLCQNGLSPVYVTVGQNLSYPNESIVTGTAGELQKEFFEPLSVMLVENPLAEDAIVTPGRPDSDFIRGEVPMTKSEVRAVTLSKLQLTKNSVCYDVGAGTGSVSLEMAELCEDGMVYAIECKPEACELIEKNKQHLSISNLQVVFGKAPEAMENLPAPTHAFIGGSSGNLKAILESLLSKNPHIRIVLNTVTVETFAEAVQCLQELPLVDAEYTQLCTAGSRKLGRYHLMTAQNPVYVISCTGGTKNA